jgi:hypothetical protein
MMAEPFPGMPSVEKAPFLINATLVARVSPERFLNLEV